jgi:hypothetical protein
MDDLKNVDFEERKTAIIPGSVEGMEDIEAYWAARKASESPEPAPPTAQKEKPPRPTGLPPVIIGSSETAGRTSPDSKKDPSASLLDVTITGDASAERRVSRIRDTRRNSSAVPASLPEHKESQEAASPPYSVAQNSRNFWYFTKILVFINIKIL